MKRLCCPLLISNLRMTLTARLNPVFLWTTLKTWPNAPWKHLFFELKKVLQSYLDQGTLNRIYNAFGWNHAFFLRNYHNLCLPTFHFEICRRKCHLVISHEIKMRMEFSGFFFLLKHIEVFFSFRSSLLSLIVLVSGTGIIVCRGSRLTVQQLPINW